MDNTLRHFIQAEKFSGNILIARKGKVILQESYGYADEGKKIPNTIETRFCVGDIQQSMTALCIMKLVQEEKLRLTDHIDWFFNHLYSGRQITVHHLLTHTSGIRNHLSLREFKDGKNHVISEVIKKMAERPLEFSPGERFLYSNTGYALLGTIIEKVTGRNLQDYIRATIFTPLKMRDSFFVGETVENLAKPARPLYACQPGLLYASGALISTVRDLYRYDQALYGDKLAERRLIEEMLKPFYKGRFIEYGYGWFIKRLFGQRSVVAHNGFHPAGHSAHLERYVDDRTTIIVVSNKLQRYSGLGCKNLNSTDLARELAARIYGKKVRFWQKWY
ncbi:MAG TPA: beta-lactamase family protein [Firmicutes bacterium]|nr:beta-lactamase family protein [Bacillota bacterium]